MKRVSLALLCGTALLISGCATEKEVALDQNNLTGVHRIAVVGPADPVPLVVTTENEVRAQQAVSAAAAIPFAGVLGAALAGGVAGAISAEIARETNEPLAKKVEAEHYQLGNAMQVAMTDALKSNGYDASEVTFTRKDAGFPKDYDSIKDQTDLVLDAMATATCTNVNSGDKSHFRPVVTMNVRLFRTSDHTVLMRKQFLLDDAVAKPDTFNIKGDTQFDQADYDTLKNDVGKCLDGVKAAVPVLTQGIAATLPKPVQTVAATQPATGAQ